MPRGPAFGLATILILYALLGILFAALTPAWQAPDEPAHYNYVRHLVERGGFPVLQMGDYPHEYLEQIKAARFPPELSIEPIRYEAHQPPLYYLLAAPIFALTGGALLPLRLFSVLIGAGIVLLAYVAVRRICPGEPRLALGTAALIAFLPQHLATVSQVGNDVLAELLLTLVIVLLLPYVLGSGTSSAAGQGNRKGVPLLGLALGLVLITKTTAYVALPLAGGVVLWHWWQRRAGLHVAAAEGAAIVLPAALLGLPWYVRNLGVYGWPDFLGLLRHDAVVAGQMRTADFIAQFGWANYAERLIGWTFKSFWGVFGWMGVFMDERVYAALAILTALAAGGLALRALPHFTLRRAPSAAVLSVRYGGYAEAQRLSQAPAAAIATAGRSPTPAFAALAILALLSGLVYVWYNVQFVQTQGRYLFTALLPFSLAFALGWDTAAGRARSRWLAVGIVGLAIVLVIAAQAGGQGLPKWPLALCAVAAAGLALRPWLPQRWDGLVFAVPFLALPVLDLYALFGVILPQLGR